MNKRANTAKVEQTSKGNQADVTIKTPDYPYSAAYYRITAQAGGKCVGHVYAYIIGDAVYEGREKYYVYVHGLQVDPAMQERGIGRKLMQALKDLAKKERCYKIIANSHRKRKAARALYASMGFVPHGREFRLDL